MMENKTADTVDRTALISALEQGVNQCRDDGRMDECSFGYETGVLITGNDAQYILSELNEQRLDMQAEIDRLKSEEPFKVIESQGRSIGELQRENEELKGVLKDLVMETGKHASTSLMLKIDKALNSKQ